MENGRSSSVPSQVLRRSSSQLYFFCLFCDTSGDLPIPCRSAHWPSCWATKKSTVSAIAHSPELLVILFCSNWQISSWLRLNKYWTEAKQLCGISWPVCNLRRQLKNSQEREVKAIWKRWKQVICNSLHKPRSTVVCFRAASSTNSASTLSRPSKSDRAWLEDSRPVRISMK